MTEETDIIERPSTLLSGMLLWLLKYGSLLLAFASLSAGVGLLISGAFQFDVVNAVLKGSASQVSVEAKENIRGLTISIGVVFIFLSFVLMVIKWLSGMVLLRNSYIQMLEKEKEIAYDKANQSKQNESTANFGQSVR